MINWPGVSHAQKISHALLYVLLWSLGVGVFIWTLYLSQGNTNSHIWSACHLSLVCLSCFFTLFTLSCLRDTLHASASNVPGSIFIRVYVTYTSPSYSFVLVKWLTNFLLATGLLSCQLASPYLLSQVRPVRDSLAPTRAPISAQKPTKRSKSCHYSSSAQFLSISSIMALMRFCIFRFNFRRLLVFLVLLYSFSIRPSESIRAFTPPRFELMYLCVPPMFLDSLWRWLLERALPLLYCLCVMRHYFGLQKFIKSSTLTASIGSDIRLVSADSWSPLNSGLISPISY